MSAHGTMLCAACDVDLHEMCGHGCTCGCHERGVLVMGSTPRLTLASRAA